MASVVSNWGLSLYLVVGGANRNDGNFGVNFQKLFLIEIILFRKPIREAYKRKKHLTLWSIGIVR